MEDWELEKNADPNSLLRAMDKYGVDIACLLPESMMDTTGYTSRWMSNGDMAKVVESNPDRFMYQPNVSPIKHKGVKNTIWEMEYWVKEKGAKIFKFYPPEDTYMNDPEIWPFYEKAEELGIVLDIHTGFCWVPPGKSKYALPMQLDDVARDFPDLKISGLSYGLSLLRRSQYDRHGASQCLCLPEPADPLGHHGAAEICQNSGRGDALGRAGQSYLGDRLCRFRRCRVKAAVEGLRNFQIPEDMQDGYGYLPITDEDRAKIFGGNLGRLLGIDTTKRRIKQ